MANYLLDATALIDYLRGRQGIIELASTLAQQGHKLGVCCITVAELYAGLREEDRARADSLIDAMEYHEVSLEIAKEAGRYRYEFARRGTSLSCTVEVPPVRRISLKVSDIAWIELRKP